MDLKELLNYSANEVRRSSDLMAVYIVEFKKVFGTAPNCVSCSFNSDFQRLKNYSSNGEKPKQKTIMAKEKTFKLKDNKVRILAYKNKKGKRVMRYTNRMDENFVIDYLSHGTKEEKEARKKEFSVLPESLTKTEEKKEPKKKAVKKTETTKTAEKIEETKDDLSAEKE